MRISAVLSERSSAKLGLDQTVRPGQTVAITAGSRGIHQIATILRAVVESLQGVGAEPFIVPAMGSHGGATAAGQVEVLASLGVTETSVGCPIRASMDTVVVCEAAEGFPVHFDRLAFEADHVFVCNRVKPHTGFTGDLQSGLMKMMLIGLGKKAGADIYHRACQDFGFAQIVRSVAAEVLQRCHIVGGVGDRRERLRTDGVGPGRRDRLTLNRERKSYSNRPSPGCHACPLTTAIC